MPLPRPRFFLRHFAATLAPPTVHRLHHFQSTSPAASLCSRNPYYTSTRSIVRPSCSALKLVSLTVLLVVLTIYCSVHPLHELSIKPQELNIPYSEQPACIRLDHLTCQNTQAFPDQLPVCRLRKMSLLQDAKRVAAEFEYGTDAVNKGVKEFIREMG